MKVNLSTSKISFILILPTLIVQEFVEKSLELEKQSLHNRSLDNR
jgi:hypothetical protein